jgi:uncharacterized RDD family membrane protein YckC
LRAAAERVIVGQTPIVRLTMRIIPLEYRTFWRRFWAGWIDGLVLWPMFFLNRWIWAHVSSVAVLGFWHVVHTNLWLVYSVIGHAVWGQTVGKRITGVKVMQVSRERLGLKRALLRDAPWWAIGILGLVAEFPIVMTGVNPTHEKDRGTLGQIFMWGGMAWFALELATMLLNQKRRAVHDLIAGSVVVRVGPAVTQPAAGREATVTVGR